MVGTTPRNMRECIDLLKCAFLLIRPANKLTLCPLRAQVVPRGLCLTRVVCSHLRNRGSNGARTRTAIVDNDNRGAWNGISATETAKTVAPASDVEVLDGRLRAVRSP
jgi:hypothetical protein